MSAFRQILVSGVVFAALPLAPLWGASSDSAEFVGGSVKSIPLNSAGSFSFGDAKELQFNYGNASYKLAYDQITGTEVAREDGRRILKVPVPSLRPGHRKETLSIKFKDASGTNGTLNFELTASQANWVRDSIVAKQSKPVQAAATQSDEWWGDRYWKTNRNKTSWPSGSTQASQPGQTTTSTPSGTKE